MKISPKNRNLTKEDGVRRLHNRLTEQHNRPQIVCLSKARRVYMVLAAVVNDDGRREIENISAYVSLALGLSWDNDLGGVYMDNTGYAPEHRISEGLTAALGFPVFARVA